MYHNTLGFITETQEGDSLAIHSSLLGTFAIYVHGPV